MINGGGVLFFVSSLCIRPCPVAKGNLIITILQRGPLFSLHDPLVQCFPGF